MTHLLIDADLMVYKAALSSEFECDWGNDNWVLSANLQMAKDQIEARLNGMQERFETSDHTLILSDTVNFREVIWDGYKSARRGMRKPIVWRQLREWLFSHLKAVSYPTLEADDTLGILQTSGQYAKSIIISEDKDMQTIPGKLFRGGELVSISLEDANRYHLTQTLTGDPTDGYKGCPGIGPARAAKLLAGNPETHWGAVVQAYENAGLTADDALTNARMAYILRAENWDADSKEVILWQPPT